MHVTTKKKLYELLNTLHESHCYITLLTSSYIVKNGTSFSMTL